MTFDADFICSMTFRIHEFIENGEATFYGRKRRGNETPRNFRDYKKT